MTTPVAAAQLRLRDLRQQARRLAQLLGDIEQAEANGETVLSPIIQARLLLRIDRLAGKLDHLAEQVTDRLADTPQHR